MGSCVSFPRSPLAAASPEAAAESRRAVAATAKVVDLDGSMARFAGPITAREALAAPGDDGGRRRSSSPPRFLCSADELGFDAPTRALAADEALQPGQLYFVLPAPMLRRPLSGEDMAALAVRAATALAAEAGLAAGGAMSPQRRRKQVGGAAGKGPRRQSTARVAPLLVASGKDDGRFDDSWNSDDVDARGGGFTTRKAVHNDGERTVGRTRQGAGRRSGGGRRHRPAVQRLSAIAKDSE